MKDYEVNLKKKEKKKTEDWVKGTPQTKGRMIRLTIDIAPDIHQKLKVKCAMERITIADMVRGWMEEKLRD